MRVSVIFTLLQKLMHIYFSNITNKTIEYKKTIFYTFRDLGGIYVKFLQILCVNQSFMSGWGGPREYEVFNKVEIEPIDVRSYLSCLDDFAYVESAPFATGSFAQLYKAKLKTGEDLAIKVLRPSIRKGLRKDLLQLKWLVQIGHYFLPSGLINYKAAYEEFNRSCLLEIDYAREVSNMRYFFNLYENHPYMVIPKVYSKYCNPYVIAQEYIEGITLADAMSSVKPGVTLAEYVQSTLGSDVWTQIMVVGGEALLTAMTGNYVFGDPHPGNIILLSNNKIALVDFGIIASRPVSQEAFYYWVKAYYGILDGNQDYGNLVQTTLSCFCPDLANALRKCSNQFDFMGLISDALNSKSKLIIGNNKKAGNLMEDGHLLKVFTEFVDSKNMLGLQLDMNNFQLLKAMQSFICSVTTIDNQYENHHFSDLMKASMEYALHYADQTGIKKDFNYKTKYSTAESYELLLDTISSIASRDEYLFQNISEEMF